MPNDQKDMERIRALLEGEQRVKSLTAALQSLTDAALKEAAAAQAQGQTQAQLNSIWAKHLPQLLQHSRDLNEAAGSLASSKRNLGMATMFLGNSIQDFQAAGIRGILNNIPQLIMAFGGGAGLAGVLTVAAVAFEQFRPQLQKLMESFATGAADIGKYTTEIEKLTSRIEKLKEIKSPDLFEKVELKTAEEHKDKVESDARTGKEMTTTLSPMQKAIAAAIPGEAGGAEWNKAMEAIRQNLQKERMDSIERDILPKITGAEAELKAMEGEGSARGHTKRRALESYIKDLNHRRTEAQTFTKEEATADLGDIVKRAQSGDDAAIERLFSELEKTPTNIMDDLWRQIVKAKGDTPENRRATEKNKEEIERDRRMAEPLAKRILARQGSADVSPDDVTLEGVQKQLEELKVDPDQIAKLAGYVMGTLKEAARKLAQEFEDNADDLAYERFQEGNEDWRRKKREVKEKRQEESDAIDLINDKAEWLDAYHKQKKADSLRESKEKVAKYMEGRPDINAETESGFLMDAVAKGITETETRKAGIYADDQSQIRRDRRWKRVQRDFDGKIIGRGGGAGIFGDIIETRETHRNLSLGEARDKLRDALIEQYVKAGADRESARNMAGDAANQAYGRQMQRGYGALKQLNEMAMTGQLGRGVQVMGSEQYIDSVQTAREGIDKQMLDVQKKAMEANVFVAEWFRRNPGLPARVGKKKVK